MKAPKITKDTVVGVLYGGLSSEREVSLRSGKNCYNALLRLGYENTVLIDVSENLTNDLKEQGVEIAFLSLHGKYGEDGTVQGLLELMKLPYTGSGVLSSALAMNKPLTKRVLSAQGLPFPKSFIIEDHESDNFEQFVKTLPAPPVMVKPLNEGSSVGVFKIEEQSELSDCVKKVLREYGGAIVEGYVSGQEITVGVLEESQSTAGGAHGSSHGTHANGAAVLAQSGTQLVALPILELRPKSKAGFYDYEAKYTKGMTEFIMPAELSESRTKEAQELAKRTFRALNCSGYARVDMIAGHDGNLYILEVNTLPGMTDTSDLPAMAAEVGMSYDQLVERILHSAGLDK